MNSHLIFPYEWVECSRPDLCGVGTHSDIEGINNFPVEWTETLLGNCELSTSILTWFDENRKPHRTNGPAIETAEGDKQWWVYGKQHRVDGPAVERSTGHQAWYVNGKLHRLDGPAVTDSEGFAGYWVNGDRHRTDGPAVINGQGKEEYWVNGERHRLDGPAIIHTSGKHEFWARGRKFASLEHLQAVVAQQGKRSN